VSNKRISFHFSFDESVEGLNRAKFLREGVTAVG